MQSAMGAIGYLARYFSLHDPTHASGAVWHSIASLHAAAYFHVKRDVGCREKVEAVGNAT